MRSLSADGRRVSSICHRVIVGRPVSELKGPQVFSHSLRQRQHQQPRVTPAPDLLELLDLHTDIFDILLRVPGAFNLELLPVAGPGSTGLVHRPLKGDDLTIGIVQDAGFRMVERTVPPRIVRAAGMIEWQGNPHLQQPSGHQPGQGAKPMTGDVVCLRAPTKGHTKANALVIAGLEMTHQGAVQALLQGLDATLIGGTIFRAPGGAGDDTHPWLRPGDVPCSADESRQPSRQLHQAGRVEVAGLAVITHGLAQDREIELVDELAGLASIVPTQAGESRGSPWYSEPPRLQDQIPGAASLLGRIMPGVTFTALPEGGFQQMQRHGEGPPKLAVAAVARLLEPAP